MFKQLIRLFVQATTVSLLFIASIAGAADNVILIGQAIDLSGPNASLGRDYVAGIRTYFDMLNSAGGINGKRIQYIVRDDQGRAELAAKAVSALIEREHVDYLFGGIGDEALDAITDSPAFQRSNHILFAPLATAEPSTGGRVLFWRPSYKQEIRHIFAHFSNLGSTDVGVVYQESPANREAYRSISSEIQDRRMKLSGTAHIDANGDKVAQAAQRLAASKPSFVLVIADTISTALFLKEYRKRDAQTFVVGTSLINLLTLRELAGRQAVEWTVFSQVVPNPVASTSVLQMEHLTMMRKYRDEEVSTLTLEGFAAAKALGKSIQHSRRGPRQALQELLANGSNIDLGGYSIAASNNRLSTYLDIALTRKGNGLVF
jgi:branched-chain amino acid transport system substrate-binding protein